MIAPGDYLPPLTLGPSVWSYIRSLATDVVSRISSESWLRSFFDDIEYQKLGQVGEVEIDGLKFNIKRGTVTRGDPEVLGKSYYDLESVATGSVIRVYQDNIFSIWYNGGFKRVLLTDSEPLQTNEGTKPNRATAGTDISTILMGDYFDKSGYLDQYVVGQETDKAFGVRGTVTENGISAKDGPYVLIRYELENGDVKEVRINTRGITVNGRPVVGMSEEEGGVNLHYSVGGEVSATPIKLPETYFKYVKASEPIGFEIGTSDLLKWLDIKSATDYTEKVAYAAFGENKQAFDVEYGGGQYDAFLRTADEISKSVAEETIKKMGLDLEKLDVDKGVRPKGGVDMQAKIKGGPELTLEVKYAGQGTDRLDQQVRNLNRRSYDLGIVFWEGKYQLYVNLATKYGPLADLAKVLAREGSRSLKDLAGIALVGGSLGLKTGSGQVYTKDVVIP